MNLRTLKKLSKRAAPLLVPLGDAREQFRSERGDSYTSAYISARKHWERMRSVHADRYDDREIKTPAKDGRGWIRLSPPAHPLKGTIMVGATEGYYEPEWSEETAWEALARLVWDQHTDWCEDGPVLLRTFRYPRDFLKAAAEMIADLDAEPWDERHGDHEEPRTAPADKQDHKINPTANEGAGG